MTEEFALETDNITEKITKQTSEKMAEITSNGLKESNLESLKNHLGLAVAKISRNAYALAERELEAGSQAAGVRGFAMPTEFISRVSDYYSRYIPIISANMSIRTFMNIQEIIKRIDRQGGSERDMREAITDSYSGIRGSGSIIIRTEGTRAISISRRALARRSYEQGKGPDYFVYKTLNDSRTTKTCKALHNHYWSYEDDDFSYWPAKHFYCRSGVVYAWENTFDKKSMKPLTPKRRVTVAGIQKKEFPGWSQPQDSALLNPLGAIRDVRGKLRGRIADDAAMEYVVREMERLERQLGNVQKTPYNQELRRMIENITRSSQRIDPALKERIERELAKKIVGDENEG